MTEMINILVIEDRKADFLMVERHLKQNGLSVRCSRVDTLEGLKEAIDRDCWDLVLADYSIPQLNFLEGLDLMREALPDVPVIMVTGTVGEEKAVDLLKLGVRDFVLKENLARLVPAVLRAMNEKRELEERRRTKERLNLALRGANDGLWDWNVKTDELYCSPRWKSMLGYAEEELDDRFDNWERLLHPQDVEPTLARLHDFLEGRAAKYEVEFRMRHKEGHYVHILSRAFLLHGKQGEALRMVGTHVDISERKKLEEQLRQAQKMEAVGQLAGGVAHDFNNMLNVILGYAEMSLLQLVPDDPLYRNLQEIRKAGERSAALTRQLLAFARKQDSVTTIINLNMVIADQLKMLERLIGEDVGIEFHPASELWNTRIDPSQIDQILANLAVNSRDAIAGTGKVIIETANVTLDDSDIRFHAGGAPGEYVLFVFGDSGAGMDAETRERIFEPFFTTKEAGKGTGLGLSTVYGIIRQNGGLINVYSEPGMGTTFKIYLPRFLGESAAQREGKKPVSMTGTETLLLVEDNEQILNLVRIMLETNGYEVLAASSPQEACSICEQHHGDIALLITDVIMPMMNGKELQARIAVMKPRIRVLFMSGYTADIITNRGVIDQGVNFISKPFSAQELTQKVREVIDG